MNSILVCCSRMAVCVASLSVLLVTFVASVSAQDIAVTKTTESGLVAADTDVTYTVSVSNSTGSTGSTTLTDTVPANMTFVSAVVPDGWDCGMLPTPGSGGTITCTLAGNMPDESAFFFTFVFHVVPGTENGTQITNTASITNAADNNSSNNSSPVTVTVGAPPPPPPVSTIGPKDVLISEFRLSGPNGSNDEYVELYCNRNTDCDLSGARLRLFVPSGNPEVPGSQVTVTFPGQTIIPARHFLLVGNESGYSLFEYGSIDFLLSTDIVDNGGVQLISLGEEPVVIDSVGFISAPYAEGTGLESAMSRPPDQYAYVRKRTMATNGLPQDTDNNADDFVLVSVTGASHAGITAPPVLGAPGPKGLTSPRSYNNVQMPASLVDQTKSKDADPNSVRVGEGDSGTLSIRRSLFNNTGNNLDYLSFRVIEIPTLNSPATLQTPQAELRLISSEDTTAIVPSRQITPILIFGTHLEYDDTLEPIQPEGGGLNSTVSIFNEGSIEENEVVDVQFLLEVRKAGSYRFFVYVEAGFPRGIEIGASAPNAPRIRATRTTPREFAEMTHGPLAVRKAKVPTPVITPVRTPVSTPAANANLQTAPPARVSTTPRLIIINRGIAEDEKKPRKKKRVRRKNSAALEKKAEERFAAERPQN
ncbi:MAG: hypothetical protein WAM70_14665 [Pyrinomonadaceae bacterium]